MSRAPLMAGFLLLARAGGCRDSAGAPRAPPAGSPDLSVSADSLVAHGEAIYGRGEYDSAGAALTGARYAARIQGNGRAEARALTWLGLAAWRTTRYHDARRYGEAALGLKHRLDYREELFRSYNALGLLAWNEGRLLDAGALLDSASSAAQATGDELGFGKAAGNRALVQVELGELPGARSGFEVMLAAARKTGNRQLEGNALTNLGMWAVRVGEPGAAITRLDSSLAIYRSIGYTTGIQSALGQLGSAYVALGEYGAAFAALDSALQLARAQHLDQDVASTLEAIADLHATVGEPRQALGRYTEAQEINRRVGLRVEEGSDLRNQAELFHALGEGGSALQRARQALRIHRETRASFEELHDLVFLAQADQSENDSAGASRDLAAARQIATQLDTRTARIEVVLAAAGLAERVAPLRVLALLRESARDLAAGGYGIEWQTHALAASAWLALGRADSAVAAGKRAVAAVERVRGSVATGAQRTSYLGGRSRAYTTLMEALLRLNRVREAFVVADAMRGRGLLEQLAAATTGDSTISRRRFAEGDSLLRRATALEERIARLEAGAGAGGDSSISEARVQLAGEMGRVRDSYEEWLARIPPPAAQPLEILGDGASDPEAIRKSLAPDEAMLAWFVTDSRLHLFVLRRDQLGHHEIEIPAQDLAARVRLARDLLGRPETANPPAVLDVLDTLLIEPARRSGELQNVRRLIVVPHGVLSYLPFAALHHAPSHRYLAEQFLISVLPSAGALPGLRSRVRASGMGAPLTVFAPEPDRLPGSRQEAAVVQAAIPGGETQLGRKATEGEARRALERGGIVHFASHATLNPSNPLFSRVELAAEGTGRPADDGMLEVHEVLALKVRSPLVFLSGCETGVGIAWLTTYGAGEDYLTLAQAFLYAGAGGVIATLWRINDRSAADLAQRFYLHLRQSPPAEALALAQRDMLRDPRHRSPYHWAAFELMGGLR